MISLATLICGLTILHQYLSQKYSKTTAFRTVILLLLSPAAFYYLAYYTESLFLLLTVLFLVSLSKKNFLFAGAISLLATGTKVVGLAFPIMLLIVIMGQSKKTVSHFLSLVISPLGAIVYMAYLYLTTSDPFIFIKSQTAFGRPVGLLAPPYAFSSWISKVFAGNLPSYDSPFVYPVIVLELLFGIGLVAFLIYTYNKIDSPSWLYVFLSFLPMLFSGSLASLPRYILVMIPIPIFMAKSLSAKQFYLLCLLLLPLQLSLASIFLRGYWVS